MSERIETVHKLVWGAPVIVLMIGVGLFLSLRLRFVQITMLPKAMGIFWSKLFPKRKEEGTSSFQALCTALAATVGTGNLVGVAGAICLGGPGAIFWMWVCGILGMATKYTEALLAVHYRVKTKEGFLGGPMYVIREGLGKGWMTMANIYALFGVVAAFGVGNAVQINAVITGINSVLVRTGREETGLTNLFLGVLLAMLVGTMLLGGAKRIGSAAERLVPFAAGAYILMCAGVLLMNIQEIPAAIVRICQGAFDPRSVTGGMLGSAFQALRVGCSRGVFTNEAGMGTASIAHASAQVSHPAEQGLMGVMEVFLDTIVICTLTALVILVSGVPIPYGADGGAELASLAFASVYGKAASVALAVFLCLFAIATILGWGLYGARCAEFLFGCRAWKYFALAQTAVVVFGSVLDTAAVWQLAEIFNGLMAVPNLITLAALSADVVRLTNAYRQSGHGV